MSKSEKMVTVYTKGKVRKLTAAQWKAENEDPKKTEKTPKGGKNG